MPLFYQHNINEFTRLGIWKIAEDEAFFLERVPLKRDVSHPHKRLQHLAGRYLLTVLFPDFPLEEILIADTRKPYLPDEKYHFSISHCGSFAAAVVSSRYRVGIDVEQAAPGIERIREKFLSPKELSVAYEGIDRSGHRLRQLTLLWSAKESIFKWYSLGSIDFRKHIQWMDPYFIRGGLFGQLNFVFRKRDYQPLLVYYKLFDDLVLSFVYSRD
ncbi:MAG TPA: 4'-phosphopantetheinyl transferase superfamily protein [Puia sp.]|nr:4'-phosphopantetheinyl transferase superfamily protein [Puia sp.]